MPRDSRGGLTVELADQEAVRIDRRKARGICKARIPAFGRGPFDRDRDFFRSHGAGGEVTHDIDPQTFVATSQRVAMTPRDPTQIAHAGSL